MSFEILTQPTYRLKAMRCWKPRQATQFVADVLQSLPEAQSADRPLRAFEAVVVQAASQHRAPH
eukprot:2320889-Amphidinium_carterae.1